MNRAPHILLVEDDCEICALVTRFLQTNDMRVSTAGDGRHMDEVLKDNPIDLIVLDVMLPGEDGLMICRRLRSASRLPVIMLTAKGEEIDRIVGLEIGADDYMTKPFQPARASGAHSCGSETWRRNRGRSAIGRNARVRRLAPRSKYPTAS